MKSFLRRLTATAPRRRRKILHFPGLTKGWLGKQVRDGRQDQKDRSQEETAEPSCHGGPGARAASLVPLCHGADHGADPPAVRRRGIVLERGRALQYLADAPGPGGQEGR